MQPPTARLTPALPLRPRFRVLGQPENQVLKGDMVSGWVLDFHRKAATRFFPPPPSDDSTDSASLVSDMSLGLGDGSEAEETLDQERGSKRKAGESVEGASHNNRLTSGGTTLHTPPKGSGSLCRTPLNKEPH